MSRCCTRPRGAVFFALLGASLCSFAVPANDGDGGFFGDGHWRVAVSPYALHFAPSAEHKHVFAVALERQRDDDWYWGASYFRNSFGQDSGYVYFGERTPGLFGQPRLFAQWSAGLMYGYRGHYQEKVPFNSNGFSPGALLSLGWSFDKRQSAQINLLGTAGLMFQWSYALP